MMWLEKDEAKSQLLQKAALAHGMGPRGSALIYGYTSYHELLESCLADLKKKEMIFGMEL
ncbi:hypothetical protein ACSBR2_031873 [Camellia fascicularis]